MFRRDLKPAVGVRWAGILAVAGTAMATSTSSFAGITANNDITQRGFSTSLPVQTQNAQMSQYSFTFPSGQIATQRSTPLRPTQNSSPSPDPPPLKVGSLRMRVICFPCKTESAPWRISTMAS